MDDDIVNIDEALSDSFCDTSDKNYDDIQFIVEQWKQGGNIDSQPKTSGYSQFDLKNPKNVDTRTFTRPKKRIGYYDSKPFGSMTGHHVPLYHQQSEQQTSISLQIGGLVTSMDRSYLGDVSPPSSIGSMDQSVDYMGNSLITSNDFVNVNDFINNVDDILAHAEFNNYCLEDVVRDRKFLDALSGCSSDGIKDTFIAKTDHQTIIELSGSANSTLQNSVDSIIDTDKNTLINNDTVTDNTCHSPILDYDSSIICRTELNDETTNCAISHGIFDKYNEVPFDTNIKSFIDQTLPISQNTFHKTRLIQNKTFECSGNDVSQINDETFPMNETYNKTYFPNLLNGTFDLSPKENDTRNNIVLTPVKEQSLKSIGADDIIHPTENSPIILQSTNNVIQSTPCNNRRPGFDRRSMDNVSPITPENDLKLNKGGQQQHSIIETHVTPNHYENVITQCKFHNNKPDFVSPLLSPTMNKHNCQKPVPLLELRDEERQSLTNFEEFEKSLSLWDGNKSEEEFEHMLNTFDTTRLSVANNKMRQSLDHIKKRHSLMNIEKQQEDQLRKESNETGLTDSNKMNESLNRSLLSTSGNGERLLRRSRVNDDISPISSQLNISKSSTDNSKFNDKSDSLCTEVMKTDRNELPENATETYLKTNTDRKNRDRFKTIRIFKKDSEDNGKSAIDKIEQSDEMSVVGQINSERFQRRDTNSPKTIPINLEKKKVNCDQFSNENNIDNYVPDIKNIKSEDNRRAISRPRYLNGIKKQDLSIKSISVDNLDNKTMEDRKIIDNKSKSQLKSPMGTKSKSIHNISSGYGSTKYSSSPRKDLKYAQPTLRLVRQLEPQENISATSRLTRLNTFVSRPDTVPMKLSADNLHDDANLFKVPQPLQLRQTIGNRRTGLMRPSSGFYSYNVKRNDSDTESGRFSPTNSLSSGSSKGSLNKQEIARKKDNNKSSIELNAAECEQKTGKLLSQPISQATNTINIDPKRSITVNTLRPSTANTATIISKPTGLRQPTNIRKSGLPRPLSLIAKR